MPVRANLAPWTVFTVALLTGVAAAANVSLVSQNGRKFSLDALQIMGGDVVRFTNDDKFVHQIYVASPSLSYESNEQPPGTNVEISFSTAGTFDVRCHIHPKMLLKVDVR
jgi:plastocyanin